jgi:hypothetical protein
MPPYQAIDLSLNDILPLVLTYPIIDQLSFWVIVQPINVYVVGTVTNMFRVNLMKKIKFSCFLCRSWLLCMFNNDDIISCM